jgi:flagellar hook-associated protein 1 FlgK
MGGLLSALNSAATALTALSQSLGISQQNVANASTPGYAAQTASIVPIGLSGSGAGGGDYIDVSSSSNSFADAAVQAASSQASASQTLAQQLTPVNGLFDITGTSGILAAFQQFSTAFASLSVTPNDPTAGAAALSAARNVGAAFNSVATSLDNQQSQVNAQVQTTTAEINSLATQIQQLNVQATGDSVSGGSAGVNTSLRNSLDQLSSLVDITVSTNANGSVSVLAGGQLPLVIGDQAYQLSVNPAAADGSQVTSSAGGNSPATFSGQLGALLQSSDTIGQLIGSGTTTGTVNTLASGFASQVNSLLTSGVNASGTAGVPIFTFNTTNPANAAGSLALDTTVTPDELGLATTGASAESNGVANQLAALASSTAPADQIGGFSAEGLFGSIAASAGQQLSDANSASTTDQTALTTAQTNRQQQIGVSLDQEAVGITTSQRSYEANAQVVTILNQLTEDAVNIIPATSG